MRKSKVWTLGIAMVVTALTLGIYIYSRTPQPDASVPCNTIRCNITPSTWNNHIVPRHCPPGSCPPKSIFEPAHCAGIQAGVAFCQAIIAAPNCTATPQANGYVKAVASLPTGVGSDRNNACAQTMTGTVIYNPTSRQVVTQYPGQ